MANKITLRHNDYSRIERKIGVTIHLRPDDYTQNHCTDEYLCTAKDSNFIDRKTANRMRVIQ